MALQSRRGWGARSYRESPEEGIEGIEEANATTVGEGVGAGGAGAEGRNRI